MDKNKKTIDFHYIKTNNYKSHYANGVFGGITPKGELQLDFFIERQVIPQISTYEISDEGNLGNLLKSEGKKDFIREIECSVIINIDTAIVINQWLGQRIDEYQKFISSKKEKENK